VLPSRSAIRLASAKSESEISMVVFIWAPISPRMGAL
jgi:hypothetical protein